MNRLIRLCSVFYLDHTTQTPNTETGIAFNARLGHELRNAGGRASPIPSAGPGRGLTGGAGPSLRRGFRRYFGDISDFFKDFRGRSGLLSAANDRAQDEVAAHEVA